MELMHHTDTNLFSIFREGEQNKMFASARWTLVPPINATYYYDLNDASGSYI